MNRLSFVKKLLFGLIGVPVAAKAVKERIKRPWEAKGYVPSSITREKVRDLQRLYNYEVSRCVETEALAPKEPYWVADRNGEGLRAVPAEANPVSFHSGEIDFTLGGDEWRILDERS